MLDNLRAGTSSVDRQYGTISSIVATFPAGVPSVANAVAKVVRVVKGALVTITSIIRALQIRTTVAESIANSGNDAHGTIHAILSVVLT